MQEKQRYLIEGLENDRDVIKWQEKHQFNYEFHNILYYAKEKYEISVQQMAYLLGVTRQTVYNYFNLKHEELPRSVEDLVLLIYGELRFEDVLKVEKLVEYHELHSKPLVLEMILQSGDLPDIPSIPKEYIEIYEIAPVNSTSFIDEPIRLKHAYDFKKAWKYGVYDKSNLFRSKQYNSLNSVTAHYLQKNSESYNNLLFNYLNQHVEPDDMGLLAAIETYVKKSKHTR